jgi:radical S-adenosyl methionine domain-containing protein 2
MTLPPAVNWHFWPWCNYGCTFCFATFEDIDRSNSLEKELGFKLLEEMAAEGVEKVTFVGGEPTLCPWLGEYLVKAKSLALTTCIVSNGTGLSEEFLDSWHEYIDWVGISIDASDDRLHYIMGRGTKADLAEGRSRHLEAALTAWERCQKLGIRMKLNTVVCKANLDDNMTETVLQLMPERWKAFQVLPIDGQNDGRVEDLLISEDEFSEWVERHKGVSNEGINFIPETNELMTGSYVMIDSLGRFYSNIEGGHKYTRSILEIGIKEAWRENQFNEHHFIEREGIYDWRTLPSTDDDCNGG